MHRGECAATGGLYRPTHLCVAHLELHKKKVHNFYNPQFYNQYTINLCIDLLYLNVQLFLL